MFRKRQAAKKKKKIDKENDSKRRKEKYRESMKEYERQNKKDKERRRKEFESDKNDFKKGIDKLKELGNEEAIAKYLRTGREPSESDSLTQYNQSHDGNSGGRRDWSSTNSDSTNPLSGASSLFNEHFKEYK